MRLPKKEISKKEQCSAGGKNMANKEKLFSRTLSGFSPEQVMSYIDELGNSHKKIVAEKDSAIERLTEDLDKAKDAQAKLNDANVKIAEFEKKVVQKDEEIARLSADTENQKQAIVAQGDKIEALESELANVKSELEALEIKNTALVNNSKEYESMLADVDSILIGARRQAESVVLQAEEKAREILSDAEKRADEMMVSTESDAKQKAKNIISEADEKLNESLKKVKYLYRRKDELSELFKEHKAKVDNFFASLSFGDSDKNK